MLFCPVGGIFGTHHFSWSGYGSGYNQMCSTMTGTKERKGSKGFSRPTGYYRMFMKDYGKLAKPLTDLTVYKPGLVNKRVNYYYGPVELGSETVRLTI